ncbi:MAG: hypothetical protein KA151_03205, partial [Piscinibacter sp.]|nr:hypothetical protein [Piscinibacter sp.]
MKRRIFIRSIAGLAALAAAPTPPAEAVTDAMADAAMRQMRAVCGSNRITREQMWAIIDAALA